MLSSAGLDELWSHPLVTRLSSLGRRMRRMDRTRPWALDTSVALGVFLATCLPDLLHTDGGPPALATAFNALPLAGMLAFQAGLVLPLLGRRRAPSLTFALIAAVFLAQWAVGAWMRADAALLVALYSLALHGRLRHLPWACATMAGVLALVVLRLSAVVSPGDALFSLFSAVTAALALGLAVRIRRSQLAGLREHAARLEVERDQRTKLAAADERARVAREMHDIVGHNLSVIITLADGGAYASRHSPQRGSQALELIAETGRQALGELRRMLGLLREQADDAPRLSPQPGVPELDALCTRIRTAGPEVVYRTSGEVDTLDPGIQLTVYRIAQEALTNALKHAGALTHVQLALELSGTRLRVRVDDTGPPPGGDAPPARPAGPGHGLAGMRERAALYRGTVTAGPRPGGGWTLVADLDLTPLPDSPENPS
ncbi:sensor histidine kinase [Streptomyces montanisoli]|uniref:sensor histidine kinase n=1 Tax=Streptomyces montanisoli TaxID=2798581 RepID=UPI001FD85885|nr:histidine kinase [Streptomyces montanisoli]